VLTGKQQKENHFRLGALVDDDDDGGNKDLVLDGGEYDSDRGLDRVWSLPQNPLKWFRLGFFCGSCLKDRFDILGVLYPGNWEIVTLSRMTDDESDEPA
jgi:hypothetical protein